MVEDLACPVETCSRHEKPFGSTSGRTLHIKSKHPEIHREQEEARSADPVGGVRPGEEDVEEWKHQIVWVDGLGLGMVLHPAPASYSEPYMICKFLGTTEGITKAKVRDLRKVTPKMLDGITMEWIQGNE